MKMEGRGPQSYDTRLVAPKYRDLLTEVNALFEFELGIRTSVSVHVFSERVERIAERLFSRPNGSSSTLQPLPSGHSVK